MHICHFEEAGRVNPVSSLDRMPMREYGMALDHLVFTCVDIAFLHANQILLARRNQYPRKSWWLIGGRMIAGENPVETASRKAREEARLAHLAWERFIYVGVYSTCFALREQPPMENGSHSVNLTYQIVLTDSERQDLQLTQGEYESDGRWVELDQVSNFLQPDSNVDHALDRALLQVIGDIRGVGTF
jgi:ADP-ribose pyrophosphatase YjhB (NUDIX family)